jgi:predicted negative regulator of RcsB-dependent stress response
VEHNASEQEQIDQIKRWWRSNGRALVAGLALGLAGLAGYRYRDAQENARAENASLNYEVFIGLLTEQKLTDAESAGRGIVEGYPGTAYARLSSLLLARLAAERADYGAAAEHLERVIGDSDAGETAQLARARLARIRLAQGEIDAAQALVAQIPALPDGERFPELRADILAARGELEAARTRYLEALSAAERLGLDQTALRLKLDNLAVADASDSP